MPESLSRDGDRTGCPVPNARYSLERHHLSGSVYVFRDGVRIGHFWPDPLSNGFAAFTPNRSKPIARPKSERVCILKITDGQWDGTEPEGDVFEVSVAGDTHTVEYADDEFTCRDCGATGATDGYLADSDGAQEWHDDV